MLMRDLGSGCNAGVGLLDFRSGRFQIGALPEADSFPCIRFLSSANHFSIMHLIPACSHANPPRPTQSSKSDTQPGTCANGDDNHASHWHNA
jgi:hypothetical protein